MATAKKNVRAARLKRADRKNISGSHSFYVQQHDRFDHRSPGQRHFLEVGWPGGLQGLP